MPATIQKILKPTKYRGIDTSTSEQIVGEQLLEDPSFAVNVSAGATGDHWACDVVGNDGVSITGGKAVWADSASGDARRLQDQSTGPFTDLAARYRITIVISDYTDGAVKFVSGSYNTGYNISGVGTHIVDMSPQTGGGNFHIDGNAAAHLSISEVSCYKLESFSNNNHGQIYSGRALEFDGVSDYLNTGYIPYEGSAYGNITYAMWIKPEAASPGDNQLYFDDRVASSRGFHGYIRSSSGILEFRCTDTGDNANLLAIDTTGAELTNSWIRLCLVYDASAGSYGTIYGYANGQLKNTVALTAAFTTVGANNLRIGANTSNIKFFEGKMSDFQVWDTAFTASDALYDYLNPEYLALNNSGTSLTESNLKLWYPMQDGHRGTGDNTVFSTSDFIMDGASTGLGDDVIDWSSTFNASGTSTDDFGNWTTNANDSTTFCTFDHDNKTIRLRSTNTSHLQAKFTSSILEVGESYKFVITVDSISGGAGRVRSHNDTTQTFSSAGEHTFYFNNIDAATVRIERQDIATDFTISDLKIYPVNQKNHAASEFFGDELITSDYADNGTFTNDNGNWAVYDPESTSAITINTWDATYGNGGDNGGLKFTISGTSTEIQGVQLGTGYFDTLVAGRTYRVSIDMKAGHPSNTDAWAIGLGGGVSANFDITQSYATYTKDIVATSDAALLVYNINDGNNRPAYIDNVSVKELGIATGWTDADQQLDIPQPALQSYNQLAWFPGRDSGTDYDINCGSDSTIDDIFNGGGTVCAWIYPSASPSPANMNILHKGHGTAPDSGWYIGIQNLSSSRYVIRLDSSFDGADGRWDSTDREIKQGAWSHIAVNWNDDSSDNNPTVFVNGESVAMTESETPSGAYNTDASRDFLIGNSHAGTRPYGGTITEISLWDTGLSKTQVRELYNDGKALDALTHSLASSNLKAYWRNNGLATWKDLKNSNDGTVTNVTETVLLPAGVDASRDNQGFLMNRQKDTNSLNIPQIVGADTAIGSYAGLGYNPIDTMTKFTVTCWVKPESLKESTYIISASDSNSLHFGILLHTNGKICMTYENSGVHEDETTATLSVGTWYFLTVIVDNSEGTSHDKIKVYVDDNDQTGNGSTSIPNSSAGGDNNMYIGTHPDAAYTENFCGQIDDICIYDDKILSYADGEIKRNYKAGKRSHK